MTEKTLAMKPKDHCLHAVLFVTLLVICTATVHAQMITTVAGNGAAAYSGDSGPATAAALNHPRGVAIDAAGNIYVADLDNSRIRRIGTDGMITTVAGIGEAGFAGDGGAATAALLNRPQAVAVDAFGNLFIADTQNRRIRKVTAAGIISTIAGNGVEAYSGDGGPAVSAMIQQAVDIVVDAAGNVFFADSTGHRVRKISSDGIITTVAGTGVAGPLGDGGLATAAQLNFPVGIAIDNQNNLYVADGDNFRIRVVSSNGIINTVAGTGTSGFSGDGGPAVSARLNYALGVRVDSSGRIFIADSANNRVRVVTGLNISTLAGTGADGYSGDGGPATSAMLNFPWALALDNAGNLLLGDRVNSRVRKITLSTQGLPVLSANGTVNGASFAPGGTPAGAVAPGSIVAIFGTDLASGTSSARAVPLPTAMADATVVMNGISAPLFYVSPGQINAQVPFEVAGGFGITSISVQVKRGSQSTAVQTAQLAAVSPGIFTVNSRGTGDGAILHAANFQLVTSGNPARAGEFVSIYCTGLGTTNPLVASGAASPNAEPLARTLTAPVVTIGGRAAVVNFSGMAPGFVGLYQINVQIPAGLGAGSQQVVIRMNGIDGNITTIATQ